MEDVRTNQENREWRIRKNSEFRTLHEDPDIIALRAKY